MGRAGAAPYHHRPSLRRKRRATSATALYLPRTVLARRAELSAADVLEVEGTLVFADISGFTSLWEELAFQGRVGSERSDRRLE